MAYNLPLILFLKCGVTKFRIPPPLSHNVTLRRPLPLTCDVIYGCLLRTTEVSRSNHISIDLATQAPILATIILMR